MIAFITTIGDHDIIKLQNFEAVLLSLKFTKKIAKAKQSGIIVEFPRSLIAMFAGIKMSKLIRAVCS